MTDDILTAEALAEIEARAQNISENFFRLGSEALWAEKDWAALLASHKAQAAEIERLEKLVFAPGLWKCEKCNFILMQRNLNAADGAVTVRDEPGDKCPNCDVPLRRVSEREAGNEMGERLEAMWKRAAAAEAKVVALTEALKPFSRLEGPKHPQSNAGAFVVLFSDIKRASAALGAKP